MSEPNQPKIKREVEFIGASYEDLMDFPKEVRRNVGFALDQAQRGEKAQNAKVLKGFGGAGVLEVFEEYQTDAYRAVYTVRLDEYVFVLHCFEKKSKIGIKTDKKDVDLIKKRYKAAVEKHAALMAKKKERRA